MDAAPTKDSGTYPTPTTPTTRLAPSPTGALHLGNARTFLINWAMARTAGWNVVLRLEDLDGPRIRPEASEQAIETLLWLGMDWDGPPLVQSKNLDPYHAAMKKLARGGQTFPCNLSRKEIQAAPSAPQEGRRESVFPASLRPELAATEFEASGSNWRFVTPRVDIEFKDRFAGRQTTQPWKTVGDFVIWTKQGTPAYQLAVVVDDARQGVTEVVRGDDLLDSAGRQLLLYRALGLSPEPRYTHLPLVLGPDGRRLAKRHGDTRLTAYQAAGVAAHRVIGLIGFWCGLGHIRQEMSAADFKQAFDLDMISPEPVVFTEEDHQWLMSS